MAAGNFTFYNNGKEQILNGTIDLDGDTIKAILVTSGYTPNVATDTAYSNVSANECADGDYTAQTLGSKVISETGGTVTFDAADVTYGDPVTITAKYLVLVKQAGGGLVAGDLLIGYVDLNSGGGSVSSTAGAFNVAWNASGIFTAS